LRFVLSRVSWTSLKFCPQIPPCIGLRQCTQMCFGSFGSTRWGVRLVTRAFDGDWHVRQGT
jgi:hypothetical protein